MGSHRESEAKMSKINVKIPSNFIIGAAQSAWQTEGWTDKKEHQDSFIDTWYKQARHVWHNGYGPAVATNAYNQYQEDVECMKEISLPYIRTSINWSRFLVDYEAIIVDETYASYIEKTIDAYIAAGVKPMICLEHYEIPQFLFDKYGGWGSKKVIPLFVAYAKEAFKRFGEKVHFWFVFNEPSVVQTRVFLDAIRYPYQQDTTIWMQWNFNKALATAEVIKVFRSGKYGAKLGAKIGTILNPEVTYPRSNAKHDIKAAEMYDLFHNRMYTDPAVKGEFPLEIFELMVKHDIAFEYTQEELKTIKENTVDILGVNFYYPMRVKANPTLWNPEIPFHPSYYYQTFELPGRKMNPHRGWEIYPEIIFDLAMRLKTEYGNIPWFISENGMGVENEKQYKNSKGIIQDTYRINFIQQHLYQAIRAIDAGANCQGYMLWAFTDNVSPMNAFKNRYGLVEIDLDDNRKRYLKKSAYWYKKLIIEREFDIEIDDENK